jgi:hypothetical protein
MIDSFLRGDYGAVPTYLPAVLLGMLLSFLSGQGIAWVYMATHRGLSYSRAFVVSLVLMPVIVALVMMVLANNLVTAFGLMAVFAIVRFRNILRDTLDTAYVLGAIVVGMACGMQKFTTAVIGCAVLAAIMGYVCLTSFGSRHRYDLILQLRWTRPLGELGELQSLLGRHSRTVQCANQRQDADAAAAEISYRLLLRDPGRVADLVHEVQALAGVAGVMFATAADESEV